jgi:hypothetical protein
MYLALMAAAPILAGLAVVAVGWAGGWLRRLP